MRIGANHKPELYSKQVGNVPTEVIKSRKKDYNQKNCSGNPR